jgi:hypothetical protein
MIHNRILTARTHISRVSLLSPPPKSPQVLKLLTRREIDERSDHDANAVRGKIQVKKLLVSHRYS